MVTVLICGLHLSWWLSEYLRFVVDIYWGRFLFPKQVSTINCQFSMFSLCCGVKDRPHLQRWFRPHWVEQALRIAYCPSVHSISNPLISKQSHHLSSKILCGWSSLRLFLLACRVDLRLLDEWVPQWAKIYVTKFWYLLFMTNFNKCNLLHSPMEKLNYSNTILLPCCIYRAE